MTMWHFARLLMLLGATTVTTGCVALPTGDAPNSDVAGWPEYTLKIDDALVSMRFHPPVKLEGTSAMPAPEDIHEVDMSWLKQGKGSLRLFTGRFEWNTRMGLPGFELGIGLEAFSEAHASLPPLDRVQQHLQQETKGTAARVELQRMKIGNGEWIVLRLYHDGSLAGESYCLPLTDTCFLAASATYGPYPRATAAWLGERRAILRRMVESIQVLR